MFPGATKKCEWDPAESQSSKGRGRRWWLVSERVGGSMHESAAAENKFTGESVINNNQNKEKGTTQLS